MKLINKLVKLFILFIDVFATKKILVLGDSHVQFFSQPLIKFYFPFTKFKVISVDGATASGLENPNSKTQSYNIFNKSLAKYIGYKKVIIMLGEVDTGFVMWYRAQKHSVSVKEMFDDAEKKYTKFISNIANSRDVVVISTPLPTITDDNDWGEIANLRKEVKASQLERTKLTIEFNSSIENFCKRNKTVFINLDPISLGGDGLVKKELLNRNTLDHHYDQRAHIKLIASYRKTIIQ